MFPAEEPGGGGNSGILYLVLNYVLIMYFRTLYGGICSVASGSILTAVSSKFPYAGVRIPVSVFLALTIFQ